MTSFLQRLIGREAPPGVTLGRGTSIKAVDGGGWAAAYAQGGINLSSLYGEPQDKAAKLLGAYKVGWFNKAERKISTDFAGLAVSVAPEDNSGDNEADVIEADLTKPWAQLDPVGQLLRLMEKPNPYQTGRQLRQKTMIRLDMAGWCFWYTERSEDGLVAEDGVYGISPTRLWPSFAKDGRLVGYVLDKNNPSGPTMTFEPDEIIPFSYGSADDELVYGVGVVEAIWAQQPLTELMARHTADLLTTGGRMAGMMWPKDRALDEPEMVDATRAWRSVVSDVNSARRLLLFPEPMEWTNGAATPDQIGIPELSTLNRDEILTSFPIAPEMLGVPMPAGLNASGESRRELKKGYWEDTIHPRVELFEETIQTYFIPRYEEVVGYTLDFEVEEPNLDDAETLTLKADALDKLIAAGFDDKEAVAAVGLEHIKWTKPEPIIPVIVAPPDEPAPNQPPQPKPTKTARVEKERNETLDRAVPIVKEGLRHFFEAQRQRVEHAWRDKLPSTKAERKAAPVDWWDAAEEDRKLTDTLRGMYIQVGRGGLQSVADTLDKFVAKGIVQNVLADLLEYGGRRIKDINDNTLQALTIQLAEGTRRGYSIAQLVDGVPAEGYTGVAGVTLSNGTAAFDPYRAEMIARTESMLSYNRATVTSYGEFGVTHLLAYDGDEDELCATRDGNEYTIEEAQNEEEHPNGTLVWSPVVDKAYHDPVPELVDKFLEAIKSMNQPTPVYITMPDVKGGDISVNTPDVTVTTPDVHVDVHVPETEAPVVTVITPDITVNPAEVVVVPAVPAVVNVPEQPAPIVNVQAAEPVVQVDVHVPEAKTTKRTVQRDKKGQIVSITDGE